MSVAAPAAGAWEYVTLRSSVAIRMEDNVQRLPDGASLTAPDGSTGRSDIIRTFSVGGSLDLPLSRQRLLLSYDINRSEYDKFTNLDFDGDSKLGTLRWELGPKLTGDAGVSQTTNQTDLADTLGRRSNLRTTTQKFFNARYPVLKRWSVGGGVSRTDSTNDDPVNRISDSATDGANLDLRYEPDRGNYLGIRTNRSEVSFPNRPVIGALAANNGYQQDALSVIAGYAPGGATSLQLSVGQTRRTPNQPFLSASTGTTGSLAIAWAPTGKTTVNFNASREFAPAEDITTDNSVIESVLLGVGWRATEKLNARGELSYQKRDFGLIQSPLSLLTGNRSDVTTFSRLSLNYAAHGKVSLSLSWGQEQRDSTLPGGDYKAGTIAATVRVVF